jgi:hypothetical protein
MTPYLTVTSGSAGVYPTPGERAGTGCDGWGWGLG